MIKFNSFFRYFKIYKCLNISLLQTNNMSKLTIEEGESFNIAEEDSKRGIEKLFGRKFNNLKEIAIEIGGITPRVYIPREISISVNKLPYEIREIPIYGIITEDPDPAEIAKIKLINY